MTLLFDGFNTLGQPDQIRILRGVSFSILLDHISSVCIQRHDLGPKGFPYILISKVAMIHEKSDCLDEVQWPRFFRWVFNAAPAVLLRTFSDTMASVPVGTVVRTLGDAELELLRELPAIANARRRELQRR